MAGASSVDYAGHAGQSSGSGLDSSAGLGGVGAAEDGRRGRVSSGQSMRPLPVLPPVSPSPTPPPSAAYTNSTPSTATHGTYGGASSRTGGDTYTSTSTSASASTSRTGHGTAETYPSSKGTYGIADTTETGRTPPTSAGEYDHAGCAAYGRYDGHDSYGATIKTPTVEKEQMASPEEYSGLGARREPVMSLSHPNQALPSIAVPVANPTPTPRHPNPSHNALPALAPRPPSDLYPTHLDCPDSRTPSSSYLNLEALKRPLSEIPQSAGSAFNAFPTARPHLPVPITVGGPTGEDGSVRSFHTASESRGEYESDYAAGGHMASASAGVGEGGARVGEGGDGGYGYSRQAQASESAGPGTSLNAPLPHPATAQGQPSSHTQGQTQTQTQNQTPTRESISSAHSALSSSWQTQQHPPASWVQAKLQIHQGGEQEEEELEDEWDEQEVEEIHFFQPALLSEAAVQLRDRVERGRHLKGGIAWVGSFTGRDLVVCLYLSI